MNIKSIQEKKYTLEDRNGLILCQILMKKIRLRKSFHHDNMDNAVGKHNSHKWVIILEMKFKIYGILK